MNEMEYYRNVGVQIQILRAAHNLSQEELAFRLGIKRVAVSMMEAGKQKMPLHIYAMLADVFNSNMSVFPLKAIKTDAQLMEHRSKKFTNKLTTMSGFPTD